MLDQCFTNRNLDTGDTSLKIRRDWIASAGAWAYNVGSKVRALGRGSIWADKRAPKFTSWISIFQTISVNRKETEKFCRSLALQQSFSLNSVIDTNFLLQTLPLHS